MDVGWEKINLTSIQSGSYKYYYTALRWFSCLISPSYTKKVDILISALYTKSRLSSSLLLSVKHQ
jgi:hypothetical protein